MIHTPSIVVYIAGPFRAETAWDVERNIRRAEELAHQVWMAGMVALCPHTNTRFFDGTGTDRLWLEGTLELLRRCDAVLFTPDWERSSGARAEKEEAERIGIPCLFSLEALSLHQAENVAR